MYAIGRIRPVFASVAVEKEFAQAVARVDEPVGATDRQLVATILSDRMNRYLARHICWVFVIEGLETYIVVPRDPADFDLLIDAVRAEPHPGDVDVLLGVRGSPANPGSCGGLVLPVVAMDSLYSFDRDELVDSLPMRDGTSAEERRHFRRSSLELFDRVMQVADNQGAADEHRALNYLAVRYPQIYLKTAEQFADGASLHGVEVRPSRLAGARSILDVIFTYRDRRTDYNTKFFVRVDVTEEFPFLVTKLTPYFDR
ncbi:cyanobactin maturation protease PatG family protein [Geodermatophilus sp. SYSU D00815]